MPETSHAKPGAPVATAATPAGKRDRSPNYPAIGPKEAMGYAKQIWERDKRNPMSVDLACQHMGYKAKNGASLPIIAALKRYGLLVSVGTDVRVSDDANTIFLAPEGLPERSALIRKMAMAPSLFADVLKRFPDGLPSDKLVRFRLRQEWEFANDKAADNFIKSLREAMALAGVATGAEIADSGSEVTVKEPEPMVQNPAINLPVTGQTGRQGQPPPLPPTTYQARSWDLGGGTLVSLQLPAKLSKGNIEKLKKYVGALEIEASIAWDDDGGEKT